MYLPSDDLRANVVVVTAHRLLFLHDEQHPTGPPEPDVWCSRLPFRGDIAHPPDYTCLRYPTRAL